ncbi:hypothetical protein SAMN02745227_00791 [Anaerobranca californiensis DSM 14826]|jgi:hypothetical protein|uniref:Sporulation membrane protein YtrI C-terminal domain-containing protein n=1 Tax=Anaerobranca californiensis DSM 14826 TaxID=1120989 RepID=A0A1M6MIE4_9FIRM|nr:hypothetical protein [Anaerobranca californiensis]SHJ83289.1 hypothetical protein SAMN02745227_00791 [Anaerobranca californiensis DSM 14826]
MAVIYFPFNKKNNKKYLSLILLGIIGGGVLTIILLGRAYDQLYLEKKVLESQVIELQNIVGLLEKKHLQQTNDLTIKEILIETDFTDTIKNLELKKKISELLKSLPGEKIDNLNPELIINILEGRIVNVENKGYILHVRYIVIAKKLQIFLNIEELKENFIE